MARIRTTAASSSSSSSSSSLLSHDHDRTNDDDDGSDAALRRRATAFVDAAHAEAVQVPSLGQSVRIFSRNPTQDTHELVLLEIPHGHTLFLTRLFLMHHLPTPSLTHIIAPPTSAHLRPPIHPLTHPSAPALSDRNQRGRSQAARAPPAVRF